MVEGENPLSTSMATPSTPWILEGQPGQPAWPQLFCFSHAGVGATSYRTWQAAAGKNLSITRIQLPGRENRIREPLFDSIPPLVAALVEALAPRLSRTFAFFGQSLGATLAFETARALRQAGAPMPLALGVAAARAPQLPWPHPTIRHLEDIPLLGEVQRRYGSIPAVMMEDRDLREVLLPTLRADLTMVETYQYQDQSPFDFPIVAFGGEQDHMVTRAEVAAWEGQTTGRFRLRFYPGGHLFCSEEAASILTEMRSVMGLDAA